MEVNAHQILFYFVRTNIEEMDHLGGPVKELGSTLYTWPLTNLTMEYFFISICILTDALCHRHDQDYMLGIPLRKRMTSCWKVFGTVFSVTRFASFWDCVFGQGVFWSRIWHQIHIFAQLFSGATKVSFVFPFLEISIRWSWLIFSWLSKRNAFGRKMEKTVQRLARP